MKPRSSRLRLAVSLSAALPHAGRMVSLAMDAPEQPFGDPAAPADVYPATPVTQRIRTLERGCLAIVDYHHRDGVTNCRLSAFSALLPSDPGGTNSVSGIPAVAGSQTVSAGPGSRPAAVSDLLRQERNLGEVRT